MDLTNPQPTCLNYNLLCLAKLPDPSTPGRVHLEHLPESALITSLSPVGSEVLPFPEKPKFKGYLSHAAAGAQRAGARSRGGEASAVPQGAARGSDTKVRTNCVCERSSL